IGTAGAGQVTFTISGLASDDSGTLTFSDQAGHTVGVTIVNGQAVDSQGHPISTVNLSSLSDGTITSSLAVSDPAGNQFSASGNAVPLDQDLGEHPTVAFADANIGKANAGAEHFTVGGLAPDDTAVITFTDHLGVSKTATVTTNGTFTVDLSTLSDGTITASMTVSDPAGNTFSATASAQLDQDIGEQLTVN